jgi:hypothetical protein
MSAENQASAKQTFTFQAMGYGIMHHEVMARQRKLAWILRQQNHHTTIPFPQKNRA